MRDWVTCVEACVSESQVVIYLTHLLSSVDSTKSAQSIRGNPTQIRQSFMNTGQTRELEIVANIIGSAIAAAPTAFIILHKLKEKRCNCKCKKEWYRGLSENTWTHLKSCADRQDGGPVAWLQRGETQQVSVPSCFQLLQIS